uniref:Uncharacterized protein n=1 Tax=Glossina pallidipes TaxID=7398 RepID=A0A1A9ZD87_GLOPL
MSFKYQFGRITFRLIKNWSQGLRNISKLRTEQSSDDKSRFHFVMNTNLRHSHLGDDLYIPSSANEKSQTQSSTLLSPIIPFSVAINQLPSSGLTEVSSLCNPFLMLFSLSQEQRQKSIFYKGRTILTIVKPHHKEPKDIHNNNVAEDFTHTYIHMHKYRNIFGEWFPFYTYTWQIHKVKWKMRKISTLVQRTQFESALIMTLIAADDDFMNNE